MKNFEEIREKLQGLLDEFGLERVKRILKEIEADKLAKEALQKLLEGLWGIK